MTGALAIPLVEETVAIEKRVYETGTVRISTITDTENSVARETLRQTTVNVRRVPVGLEVNEAPATREEDGVLIVPIVEERLVIEKRLVLVEELHITREHTSLAVEVPVTRRVMRAVVERDALPTPNDQQRGFDGKSE